MKRTNIHIFAALALLLGLAACTQDEAGFLPEGAEGTPIVFTATGLNSVATAIAGTRAPVDGNWEGVQSVAVLMDGTVKAYDVTPTTADPTSATLTSTDPYYWTNHNDITVTAWWPYTAGEIGGGGRHVVRLHHAVHQNCHALHTLPIAIRWGTGAGGGCRSGVQPRGGEDDGCAFRPFRQETRFVLCAGAQ